MTRGRTLMRAIALATVSAAAVVAGCAANGVSGPEVSSAGAPGATTLPVLRREDVAWLERVTFGLDSPTLSEFGRLGRTHYLERQLHPGGEALPAPVAAQIAALDISHLDVQRTLAALRTVLNDYRAVLGGLFGRLWSLRRDQCEQIFPGCAPLDLGLV